MGLLVCVHMLLLWPIFAAKVPFSIAPHSARIEGASLKQENASVTLVDSVFLAGVWMSTNMTVTFDTGTNAKNGVHQRVRSKQISQKQLS